MYTVVVDLHCFRGNSASSVLRSMTFTYSFSKHSHLITRPKLYLAIRQFCDGCQKLIWQPPDYLFLTKFQGASVHVYMCVYSN